LDKATKIPRLTSNPKHGIVVDLFEKDPNNLETTGEFEYFEALPDFMLPAPIEEGIVKSSFAWGEILRVSEITRSLVLRRIFDYARSEDKRHIKVECDRGEGYRDGHKVNREEFGKVYEELHEVWKLISLLFSVVYKPLNALSRTWTIPSICMSTTRRHFTSTTIDLS
jgi:hypothetical protein